MKKAASLIFVLIVLVLIGMPVSVRAQSVQITAPADDAIVHPGETVTIIVKGSPGIQTAIITVEKPLPAVKEIGPLQYALTIPSDLPEGTYHIRAMSQSTGQFVETPQLTLNIAWPGKLVSAELYPNSIGFDAAGQNMQLKVLGTFDNGAQGDVARSAKSIYATTNVDVATVSLDGVVTSLGPGEAKIVFKNSGIVKAIPVTVAEAKNARIVYDLEMKADSPFHRGEGKNYYTTHVNTENKGNIPLAYIKILSVQINDRPALELPPEKFNLKMGDQWSFDLGFPAAAGARGTKATLEIKGVYSDVPEFYHRDQPFDSVFTVELP